MSCEMKQNNSTFISETFSSDWFWNGEAGIRTLDKAFDPITA